MKNQRKRVGRPLKEAKEIKLPFHGTLPAEVHDLISQSNLSYGYLTEYAARHWFQTTCINFYGHRNYRIIMAIIIPRSHFYRVSRM